MQSTMAKLLPSSLSPLLRRNLLLLAALSLCLLFTGVFTKQSQAQTVPIPYTISGYSTASIDPNGGTNSFIALADGSLSWDGPANADAWLRWDLIVDGVLLARNYNLKAGNFGLSVSHSAFTPSDFSFTYPFTLSSGLHHIYFKGEVICTGASNTLQWYFDYDVNIP